MENEINIAEILKDCSKGTKLYTPLFGEVTFGKDEKYSIIVYKLDGIKTSFTEEGHYTAYPNSECVLFPSSEMRDWTKFFKRGDVVRSIDDGAQAVFKGWESDDYTSFYASIVHHAEVDEWDEDIVFAVESFYKECEEFARGFIVDAEEHYNGKYNPDTLRVEPVKPECPFMPFDKVLVRDDDEKNGGRVCLHITMKTLNILMSVSHMYTHSASPTTSTPPTSLAQPTHTRKEAANELPLLSRKRQVP